MKAYIAVSYSKRKYLSAVLDAVAATLHQFNIAPFIFVDQYDFTAAAEKEMMQQALTDIDSSDILIAETSDKAIGIGIEAGYAKAKNIPVIYMRHIDAEHSTTVAGISDFQIIYTGIPQVQQQLAAVLAQIFRADQKK